MKLVRFENPVLSHFAGFGRLSSLENELNRLFTESTNNSWAPLVELSEDKNNFLVTAELPGLKKEDIDVTLLEGVLTISGERKQERKVDEEGGVHRSERYFGRFERSLMLPSEVTSDGVKADYKDGLLTVTLPKTEAAKPKKIGIGVS